MAGAGYKLFNTGDVLLASEVNTYLQQQTVMVFASSAARTTALSGVLAEGMMSYLQDTNSVEVYNGSSWVNVGNAGDITGVTAGTGISGGGSSGDVTITNSMATAIDAKGDLIVGTGADTFSRLAVGTNGHTLVADSGAGGGSVGLKWAVDPVADIVTTAGDILYATAADTLTRLAIGTAGQVLKVNSGATAPEWGAAGGGGKVLQVVNATYSTQTSNATSSYTDTGLTASITPSATNSKVLVIVHQVGLGKANDNNVGLKLFRGATELAKFEDQAANTGTSTANHVGGAGISYLDSPNTTSSTTYKTQFRGGSTSGGYGYVQIGSAVSSITLLEIGA